jgi:hypothetical protein
MNKMFQKNLFLFFDEKHDKKIQIQFDKRDFLVDIK